MNNRIALPANTTKGRSFEYGMRINLATFSFPSWQDIRRISGFAPTFPATTSDAATYDDGGAPNEEVDGRGVAIAFTVQANRNLETGLYLPEVEALLRASRSKGEAATVDVLFFHKPVTGAPNPTDAGRATCRVEATRQNTGNTGVETWAITLTGQGEYEPIENPWAGFGPDVAPRVGSVVPAEQGALEQVIITGVGFLGATAVEFGATSAAAFTVVNDSTIVASLDEGAAGVVTVTVTNAVGESVAVNYLRAA